MGCGVITTIAPDSNSSANDDSQFWVSAPQLSFPKKGGAIRGIGVKFATNLVTGRGVIGYCASFRYMNFHL
jgi:hypothetical protein